MILGIMQPYFFPHLGYFDLINYSDQWIVFDTVKHIRHGWVSRNRVHHPTQGWQYVGVPLKKHGSDTDICDIQINNSIDWRSRIIGQLQHYKKHCRRFTETVELVESCLATDEIGLSRLNVSILDKICHRLGITFHYQFLSEMKLPLDAVSAPGDWALNISVALGASSYVNPPGGRDLFDVNRFTEKGIQLQIRDIPPLDYVCAPYEPISRLSIIDLLMWNPPGAIYDYLQSYKRNLDAEP